MRIFSFCFVLFLVFGTQWFVLDRHIQAKLTQFPTHETPALGQSQFFLAVESSQMSDIHNNESAWIAVRSSVKCEKGPVVLLEQTRNRLDYINGYYLKRATAAVIDVFIPKFSEQDRLEPLLLARDIRVLFSQQQNEDPLCIIKVQIQKQIAGDEFSQLHVPAHPFVKTVSIPEALNLDHAVLIDVRSAEEFSKGTLKGAVNIPYLLAVNGKKRISREELDFVADKFLWPPERWSPETPFVIFSDSPRDTRAIRAIDRLYALNIKNIFWIWGGFAETQGLPLLIPETIDCCEIVTAQQAQVLHERGIPVFAASRYHDFNQTHIQGAFHCTIEMLAGDGGCKQLPVDKSSPLLLYGNDESSTETLDLAQRLNKLGWQKIYLLRRGLGEWLGRNTFEPHKYKVFSSSVYKHPTKNEVAREKHN